MKEWIVPAFYMVLFIAIIFIHVGVTGAILGLVLIFLLQALLTTDNSNSILVRNFGEKIMEYSELKFNLLRHYKASTIKSTLINIILAPILYYYEISSQGTQRIFNIFTNNKIACSVITIVMIFILFYPLLKCHRIVKDYKL